MVLSAPIATNSQHTSLSTGICDACPYLCRAVEGEEVKAEEPAAEGAAAEPAAEEPPKEEEKVGHSIAC